MGRLVVVCNRVNPPSDQGGGTLGGVAVALSSALRAEGGMWFGWSGRIAAEFAGEVSRREQSGITFATIALDREDAEEYLTGYANRAIWPFFHSLPVPFAGESTTSYERITERFAASLAPLLAADDARGFGAGTMPAEEALATVVLERSDRPLVASNADLSASRVGGLGIDLAARFLRGLVETAGLVVHVRLIEGTDSQHVLEAIFKALGVALAEACRPRP